MRSVSGGSSSNRPFEMAVALSASSSSAFEVRRPTVTPTSTTPTSAMATSAARLVVIWDWSAYASPRGTWYASTQSVPVTGVYAVAYRPSLIPVRSPTTSKVVSPSRAASTPDGTVPSLVVYG